MIFSRAVLLSALVILLQEVESFLPLASVHPVSQQRHSSPLYSTEEKPKYRNRKSSKVTDPDGPTPELPVEEPVAVDDIPELREIENEADMPPGPIPHQPWRRGMTAGCEDPISAPWRKTAEEIMKKAVKLVGGTVLDVTWYLTTVLVTIDADDLEEVDDILKASGPPIDVVDPRAPMYYDPNDPQPEEIWVDEEDFVYQRETEEEAEERKEKKRNMYAPRDKDDPEDEPHIPAGEDDQDISVYMNKETREDAALTMEEEEMALYDGQGVPVNDDSFTIDTAAISTIAGAILDSMEELEDDLQILSRHELVLCSQGPPHMLQTQRQFDEYRGADVVVQTVDPWNSNRRLQGKLLERNSMDVIINKKGRMVTIPNNFVASVTVARMMKKEDLPGDDE